MAAWVAPVCIRTPAASGRWVLAHQLLSCMPCQSMLMNVGTFMQQSGTWNKIAGSGFILSFPWDGNKSFRWNERLGNCHSCCSERFLWRQGMQPGFNGIICVSKWVRRPELKPPQAGILEHWALQGP